MKWMLVCGNFFIWWRCKVLAFELLLFWVLIQEFRRLEFE